MSCLIGIFTVAMGSQGSDISMLLDLISFIIFLTKTKKLNEKFLKVPIYHSDRAHSSVLQAKMIVASYLNKDQQPLFNRARGLLENPDSNAAWNFFNLVSNQVLLFSCFVLHANVLNYMTGIKVTNMYKQN